MGLFLLPQENIKSEVMISIRLKTFFKEPLLGDGLLTLHLQDVFTEDIVFQIDPVRAL